MRVRSLAVAVLLMVAPSASATGAYGEQIAGAMWIVEDGGRQRAFLAVGVRFFSSGLPVTIGMVASGSCRGSGHHVQCHMKARAAVLEDGAFVVDPTASSASLEMTTGRHDHHVSWTSDVAAPSTYSETWSGPGYVEGWAGAYRTGWAEGTLFSQDVARADVESASIGIGGSGDLHALLDARSFVITARPDGSGWSVSL